MSRVMSSRPSRTPLSSTLLPYTTLARGRHGDAARSSRLAGCDCVAVVLRPDRAGRKGLVPAEPGGALPRRCVLLDLHPAPAAADGRRDRAGSPWPADPGEAADHLDGANVEPAAELRPDRALDLARGLAERTPS